MDYDTEKQYQDRIDEVCQEKRALETRLAASNNALNEQKAMNERYRALCRQFMRDSAHYKTVARNLAKASMALLSAHGVVDFESDTTHELENEFDAAVSRAAAV